MQANHTNEALKTLFQAANLPTLTQALVTRRGELTEALNLQHTYDQAAPLDQESRFIAKTLEMLSETCGESLVINQAVGVEFAVTGIIDDQVDTKASLRAVAALAAVVREMLPKAVQSADECRRGGLKYVAEGYESTVSQANNALALADAVRKPAFQDGAQFYAEETGDVIADYASLVRGDFDMAGAEAARAKFVQDHPGYRLL